MTHLIDKSALVAEIEKYYHECLKRAKITDSDYWNAKADAYRNVLGILDDTLEVEEVKEESLSEELKEAAQEYVTKEGYLAGLHYNSMVRSFKAGAEWYASHNTKLPDNLLLAARKASIERFGRE